LKVNRGPSTLLTPCPVILLTCTDGKGNDNIITLAWVGVVCSDPPKIGVGIRHSRYSSELIDESGEFVVNIPDESLLCESDYCGNVSGRDVNKFDKTGLTRQTATKVSVPLIKECPVNLECLVREKFDLGSHRLYVGEVVETHVDEKILDAEGKIDFKKADLIVYNSGEYWSLGKKKAISGFAKDKF
jgi:flavin reductase (DIM6/NTAB) family NADH-FMN oxidoreductase RutF